MNNADIRKKALSKVKVKNLTLLAVISYLFYWLSQFASGVTGNFATDAAIGAGVALLFSLFFPAGLARASMSAWRQGEARFVMLFEYLFRPRLLVRGLVLGLAAAAFRLVMAFLFAGDTLARIDALPGNGLWLLAVGVVAVIPLLFLWIFLYFALELQPEAGLGAALAHGLSVAAKNLGRILLMEFSLLWWVALIWLGALVVSMLSELAGAALNAVTSLVAAALTWMIGAYVCLANAGLAREIYKS
jgi:hypothetical protein